MIQQSQPARVGYVVKRYPRFSETFIVREILAHERAGWDVVIFSLLPPCDAHFQDNIAKVRAPVVYLPAHKPKGSELWECLQHALRRYPAAATSLANERATTAQEVLQALALTREIESRQIQHLHAHFATSAATVARLASRITTTPYSFTAHAKDIFHRRVDERELGQKIADSVATVTVSDYNVNHLRSRFPRHADKVTRIYNGLDLSKFSFSPSQPRQSRVISVGRLVEKKGFSELIEAISLLATRGIEVQCDIIGEGPLRSQLERLVVQRDVANIVRLLGATTQHEVIRRIRNAMLLAAPCVTAADGDRDGLPTVVLEAMALGTPCVGTDVTGLPEILRDESTGCVAPAGDPRVLAAKIERLLQSEELRQRLAGNARARIENDFDIEKNSAQLRGLFKPCWCQRTQRGLLRAEAILNETSWGESG